MSSSLKMARLALRATTALFLIVQAGLVTKAQAQNADAELHAIDSTQIKCIQRRKPAIGTSGYDMEVECTAEVSGIIGYVYPSGVRYRITARIESRGYGEKDLPPGEQPVNKDGLTAMGTGKVTVPVSIKTSTPIESWNKQVDYCRAGNFPASIVLSVAIPIGDNGESNYSDVRNTTVDVDCTSG